jgi:hypothetical protein
MAIGFPPNESWPNEDAAAAGAATNMEDARTAPTTQHIEEVRMVIGS